MKAPPASNRRLSRPPEGADESPAPAPAQPSGGGTRSARPPARNDRKASSEAPPKKPKGPGLWVRLSAALAALKLVVGIVIVVGASAGVAWGARRYVLSSPRFAVKTITIEGASRVTPEKIAEAGGVAVGDNVLGTDLDVLARRIEAEPWVESAVVRRKLPSTLSIVVVEHEPYVLVALVGDLFLASRDGLMFKKHELGDPTDLPLVTGLRPSQIVDDRVGAELVVRRAAEVVTALEQSSVGRRWPVQEVHVEKDGSTSALVGREGITLQLGSPPYEPKVAQAERVLDEVSRRRANAAIVFLDNETNPDRVVVRMR